MVFGSREPQVLTSWKEIAAYLGKGVRTVQRWERDLGLPILRPAGNLHKSCVLAHPEAIRCWLTSNWSQHRVQSKSKNGNNGNRASAPSLAYEIQAHRQLRAENKVLTEEIRRAVKALHAECLVMQGSCSREDVSAPCREDLASAIQQLPKHTA